MPKPVVKKLSTKEVKKYGNGCGHGYDHGYGCGNGYGHGYGDGYGYGNGKGNGYDHGKGKGNGTGNGAGYSLLHSFSVQGDENLLGVFYAKASFLDELPRKEDGLTLANLATLVDWLTLAKELGLEAKAVLEARDNKELEELEELYV